MTWPPSATWQAAAAKAWQRPRYFVRFDGLDQEALTDIGFEDWTTPTDLTSWVETGGGSHDREATIIYDGTFGLKMTRGPGPFFTNIAQNGFTLAPNTKYRVLVRLRGGTTGKFMRMFILNTTTGNELQADGAWGAGPEPDFTVTSSTEWQRWEVTFTTESSGTTFDFKVAMIGYAETEIVYVDWASILPMPGDFSTGVVGDPSWPKTDTMNVPIFTQAGGDPIEGTYTPQRAEFSLLDIDGEITKLVATEAFDSVVRSMINHRVRIFAGYAELDEKDYAPIFTGRVIGLSLQDRSYRFELADILYRLDKEIMSIAGDGETHFPSRGIITIEGNLVNVYWSILTDTFDTGHADFPLTFVSVDSFGFPPNNTAAPNGIGIPRLEIDEELLKDQRTIWHDDTEVKLVLQDKVNAREYLEHQLFRMFQCFPAVSGDGRIGLRFWNSNVAVQAPPLLDDVAILAWERRFDLHLNKFLIEGDFDAATGDFETVLYNLDSASDIQNRADTEETIEIVFQSEWLASLKNGSALAQELAGRLRNRLLEAPAEVRVAIPFSTIRILQLGEVVRLSDDDLPDLLVGTVGLSERTMTIIALRTDAEQGTIEILLQDTGYTRAAGWGPTGTQNDYDAATDGEKELYVFVAGTDGRVGAASERGYVWL